MWPFKFSFEGKGHMLLELLTHVSMHHLLSQRGCDADHLHACMTRRIMEGRGVHLWHVRSSSSREYAANFAAYISYICRWMGAPSILQASTTTTCQPTPQMRT